MCVLSIMLFCCVLLGFADRSHCHVSDLVVGKARNMWR